MLTASDLKHAQIVLEQGFASQEEVARCMNEIKEKHLPTTLVDLMLDRGLLTAMQVGSVTAASKEGSRADEDKALGDRAVQQGYVSSVQVGECMRQVDEAVRNGDPTPPRLGQVLMAKGYITEFQFQKLVSAAPAPARSSPTPWPAASPVPPPVAPAGRPTPRPVASPVPPAGTPAGRPTPRPAPSPIPGAAAPARRPTPRPAPSPVPPAAGTQRRPTPRPGPTPLVPTPPPMSVDRCTFCGIEIRDGQAQQPCKQCGSVYHQWCWMKTKGCVQTACQLGSGLEDRVKRRSYQGFVQGLIANGLKIGVGAGAIVLGIFLYTTFARDASYYYELGRTELAKNQVNTSEDSGRAWRAADLHRGMLAAEDSGTANIERTVNFENAIHNFRKAVDKKPDFVEAWFDMGLTYLELKRPKDAFDALKKVIEIQPDHAEAMVTLGTACDGIGDSAGAEKWYKQALAKKPDLVQAHELLAYLYDDKMENMKDQAVAEYRIALDKKPEDANLASRLSRILIDQGKVEEALSILSRSEKLDPSSAAVQEKLALLYSRKGEFEKALGYVAKVVQGDPKNWTARTVQAVCLEKLGRYDEAYAVAKEVVSSYSDNDALAVAGRLAIRAGEPDRGIAWLQQSMQMKISPESIEAIGDAYMALDRPEQAKDQYEKLWSLNTDDPRVRFKVGLAFCSTKDRAVAAGKIKDLLARDPKNPDLRALEARLVGDGGKKEECLQKLNAIVADGGKTPFVCMQIGITYRELGNGPAALGAFRAALAIEEYPDALYEMGMTYSSLKNEEAAKDFLGRYMQACSYGKKYDEAKRRMGGGPVATGGGRVDDLSYPMSICENGVRQLSAGSFVNPQAWDWTSAGVHGIMATMALVMQHSSMAQGEAANFQAALQMLGTAPAAQGYVDPAGTNQYRESALGASMERWAAEFASGAGYLLEFVKKLDKDGKLSKEIEAATNELRGATTAGGGIGSRLEGSARAFTAAMRMLILAAADSKGTRDGLMKLDVEHKLQLESCRNPLQNTCAEVYRAVKLAALFTEARDSRGVYTEKRMSILSRFDAHETEAKTVLDQVSNAATATAELLWIVASDPALRP